VEWRTLRWAPDFGNRAHALELAAIDAAVPWPVNMACNAAINGETKTLDIPALTERCRSITVPVLVVHGALDPRPPYAIDDLAAAIPRVEVAVIDDVGHLPWLERPGAVALVLRRWLAARF
jgi:pimeloyl-ACP methyl ester carboxylesterase